MNWLAQFHFIRPWCLLAIIPALLLVVLILRSSYQTNSWTKVCDPHLLPHLLVGTRSIKQRWPLLLLAIGWLIAIIALAGPTWKQYSQPVYQSTDAKILVVDMSSAMLATDLKPSRLARARYKIQDILKETKEGRIGLIAYADEPYVVSPLTEDAKTIATMVPELTPYIMPVEGHNTVQALKLAENLFQQANVKQGTIILITAKSVSADTINTVKQLAREGYKTSVLGIGTKSDAPIHLSNGTLLKDANGNIVIAKLDKTNLEQLANAGQGNFSLLTTNNDDITKVMSNKKLQAMQKAKSTDENIALWQDQGHWFILLLLPIVLIAFRRGWLMELFK